MQWYNRYILSMVWYYCRLKLGLLNAVAWLFNIIIIRLIMVTRAPLSLLLVPAITETWSSFTPVVVHCWWKCMKKKIVTVWGLNKKSYFTVAFHSISFCETVSHSLKWKEKKENGWKIDLCTTLFPHQRNFLRHISMEESR